MIDTLLLKPSPYFTTLHSTLLLAFKLHPTTLHFTTLSFGLTPFKFPTAPFHLTSLHFTSLHFTAFLDNFRHTSIPFAYPAYNCFPNSLEILSFHEKVPKASAGSWFQFFLWSHLQSNTSRYPFSASCP